jgi:hypothetical protein
MHSLLFGENATSAPSHQILRRAAAHRLRACRIDAMWPAAQSLLGRAGWLSVAGLAALLVSKRPQPSAMLLML